MKTKILDWVENLNTTQAIQLLLFIFLLLIGITFVACQQEALPIPQIQIKPQKGFEAKLTPNGKFPDLIKYLEKHGYEIENKTDLLALIGDCERRITLSERKNIDIEYLTQVAEEIDLLRSGIDIVTIQILQNCYYQGQGINEEGTISVGLVKSNSKRFESKKVYELIQKWIPQNRIDFPYQIPLEHQLKFWLDKCHNLGTKLFYCPDKEYPFIA